MIGTHTRFETFDGEHEAWLLPDGRVRLHMHIPQGYQRFDNNNYFIDSGSPHHVQFLDGRSIEAVAIRDEGAALRHHPRYAPGGANANFVESIAERQISVRTFERGVEDETLSCGTGVTACAYIHLLNQNEPEGIIEVNTPGGKLEVEVQNRGSKDEAVYLTGPVVRVFSGVYLPS
jgi:diaminopimelate epimerase